MKTVRAFRYQTERVLGLIGGLLSGFIGSGGAFVLTPAMIDALRQSGYDDVGILDLAIAVADANSWARIHRLAGLPPGLVYLG